MSAAGHLHSFYTGCEAVLARIARELDEMPQGERWHQVLLAQAAAGREGRRPPKKLRAHAASAAPTFEPFRAEIGAFLRALEAPAPPPS